MTLVRLCCAILLSCSIGLYAGCSQKSGPLLVFSERGALPVGGRVNVQIENSDYSQDFTSLPHTLQLRVDSRGAPFVLVVTVEIFGLNCPPFTQTIAAGISVEIDIDISALVATCTASPGTDGGDAPADADASGDSRADSGDSADSGDAGFDSPDSSSSDSSEGGADAGPCAGYCAVMARACPESYQANDCAALCQAYQWPPGTEGDRGLSTVACRMTYATFAASATTESDRKRLCLAAGASGSNTCGSLCEDYCAAVALYCPALLRAGSIDRCVALECLGPAIATDPAISTGDTLDCRIYWIGKAATNAELCSRGALTPQDAGPCVNN